MDTKHAALLLIDMQNESSYGIKGLDAALENAANAISACRDQGIPVIYTRHTHRRDGLDASVEEPVNEEGAPIAYRMGSDAVEIHSAVRPKPGEPVIDKHRWSGFFATGLDLILRTMKVDTLLVGGFVTDGCVMTTIYDGFFRNYRVVLAKDMAAATTELAHAGAVVNMANWVYGLTVIRSEELCKAVRGEDYNAWRWAGPDQLLTNGDSLFDAYDRLE